ncbi:hypothetical protein DM02DRAFT_616354 [Periconia macrospinosa]|uniref:F-box domain-containing protein n=1 Tax=Periconia macrospinosa TaxID=97972 RepID=A0A2V1DKE1_9PLEO|nr:hypothetical protein DM02DRAFT_616354 [Periconia macrospinosa]
MDSTEAELESFRQQWREEVSARSKDKQPRSVKPASSRAPQPGSSKHPKSSASETPLRARRKSDLVDEVQPHVYHDLGEKQHGRRLDDFGSANASSSKEPQSALEHYEQAVEKESQGSLGDSLNLYRKAFKLDHKVHESYKAKHFPPSYFASLPPVPKPQPPNPTPTTNTAHHSLAGLSSSFQDLLNSFSNLTIEGQDPPTEFDWPPPCPIATIPEEILSEILMHLAVQDAAAFVRLSQVCKRLAYLVATEDRVWKRLALGHEYGFAAMHYQFACQIDGKPLGDDGEGGFILGDDDLDIERVSLAAPPNQELITSMLVPSPYPNYLSLFRRRPRIRFNGCYISTVNYTRPGASSPLAISWNSPIHIVTYYRYLRFYRDGTCISLLTTSEPSDIVPYLSTEHVHKNHGALPSAPMKDAMIGRWRISGPDIPGDADAEKEGLVVVEKAGVSSKYLDKMELVMGSAGRGARNNKLAWQAYWSYNRLTDDWAPYGLKNDRAFYWSRVKSYGMGLGDGR